MKRHSLSLFISIILHLFLATLLFLSYHYIFKSSPKKEQEHLLCLQLANYECATPKKEIITPQKHFQTHQRVTQKSRVKIHKKQAETKIPKKVKIKKVIQEPKDNVESIKKPDNSITDNTIKVTQKRSKTQAVEKKVQKTNEETYVDANIQKIVRLLQNNLYYPRRARKRGIQGDVTVTFHLSTDATISQIKVLSCDNAILSRGAIRTIENLSNKFPHPKEDLTLTLPISYHFQH